MFRLKISKADKYFSLLVRLKADWTCERCRTTYEPPTTALHCSHFHGRSKKSVRFDFENAISACYGCHRYLGSNPVEHHNFFLKRLGKKRFELLNLRANTPAKVDEKLLAMFFKTEYEMRQEHRMKGKLN